jgi:hypothetical protein
VEWKRFAVRPEDHDRFDDFLGALGRWEFGRARRIYPQVRALLGAFDCGALLDALDEEYASLGGLDLHAIIGAKQGVILTVAVDALKKAAMAAGLGIPRTVGGATSATRIIWKRSAHGSSARRGSSTRRSAVRWGIWSATCCSGHSPKSMARKGNRR